MLQASPRTAGAAGFPGHNPAGREASLCSLRRVAPIELQSVLQNLGLNRAGAVTIAHPDPDCGAARSRTFWHRPDLNHDTVTGLNDAPGCANGREIRDGHLAVHAGRDLRAGLNVVPAIEGEGDPSIVFCGYEAPQPSQRENVDAGTARGCCVSRDGDAGYRALKETRSTRPPLGAPVSGAPSAQIPRGTQPSLECWTVIPGVSHR